MAYRFALDREQSLLVARDLLAADPYVYWNPYDGPEREWTILEACQLVRGLSEPAFAQLWRDYAAGGDRRAFAAALLKHFKRTCGGLGINSDTIEEAVRAIPDEFKSAERVERLLAVAHISKHCPPPGREALFRFALPLEGRWIRGADGREVSGHLLAKDEGLRALVLRRPDRAEEIAQLIRERGVIDPQMIEGLLDAASSAALSVGAL